MEMIGCQFGSVVDHVTACRMARKAAVRVQVWPPALCGLFPPLSPLSCQSTVSILYRQNAKKNPGFVSQTVYELPLSQQELWNVVKPQQETKQGLQWMRHHQIKGQKFKLVAEDLSEHGCSCICCNAGGSRSYRPGTEGTRRSHQLRSGEEDLWQSYCWGVFKHFVCRLNLGILIWSAFV